MSSKLHFKDPRRNRDTFARLEGNLDPTKEKFGWIKGRAVGVPRMSASVSFSMLRVSAPFGSRDLRSAAGSKLLREIVFYRDIETGKIMDSWQNRYSMINRAFDLLSDHMTAITAIQKGRMSIIEIGEYPTETIGRPGPADGLLAGNAMVTIAVDDLDMLAFD